MPFHLAPTRKPRGPNVYPITTDPDGRKRLHLMFDIDKSVSMDTIQCELDGHALIISSTSPIGQNADGTPKIFRKNFQIPDNIWVEKAQSEVFKDGRLRVQLLLMDEGKTPNFKCTIKTEQVW